LKAETVKNNEVIGYLTGTALYNQLGLTTQVANELVIARKSRSPQKNIKGYKVRFIANEIKFRKKDISLLQLLDALRDIKNIPDTSVEKAMPILVEIMKALPEQELRRMITLSKEYNPATRALLGSVLDCYFPKVESDELLKTLNPLSKYRLGIHQEILPSKQKWNIE